MGELKDDLRDDRHQVWVAGFHCVSGVFFLSWLGWHTSPVFFLLALWALIVGIDDVIKKDQVASQIKL